MKDSLVSTLIQALGSLVLVGGAVRDKLLGRDHGDWDLATPSMPEEIMRRAKAAGMRAIPTGLQHGTVTVILDHETFEITTFRGDGPYLDGRRPSKVILGVDLDEDLARRDFTINAMALPLERVNEPDWADHLIDPFHGLRDLDARLIRAVGDPQKRFAEDGLRCLRACRFAAQLEFDLDPETLAAIPQRLDVARKVSVERVFAELNKMLCAKDPARGLRYMERTGLLDLWLPELRPMVGCLQNRHHRLDVWEHTLETFSLGSKMGPAIPWALLLHDAGKPATKTTDEKGDVHFYGHEPISARMASEILARLRAPNRLRDEVAGLILMHGEHPTEEWSAAAYRRLLKRLDEARVSPDAWYLFRLADQYGKGWKRCGQASNGITGEAWWASVKQEWMIILKRLEAERFPGMTTKELALDGNALMELAGREAGPWISKLQNHLLEAVLERPEINNPDDLGKLAKQWLEISN